VLLSCGNKKKTIKINLWMISGNGLEENENKLFLLMVGEV
jgi:hypothetical protein